MAFSFKNRTILIYGIAMAALVFLLKLFQWKFLILENSVDIYVGLIALFFTGLGVWIATQLVKPKVQTVVIEKEVFLPDHSSFEINLEELKRLNLSDRELEVLRLITQGFSNAEIGSQLYLSVSTVKTHVSNLFSKMEVKSRTQAIERAKRLNIIV